MSLEHDTNRLATASGYTDTTSADTSLRDLSLTKSMAHKLLNEVKAGVHHHPVLVTQALIATGDWSD